MKKMALLVGARPNYMKIAPLCRVLRKRGPDVTQVIIHTGQHYDKDLSDVLFADLALPKPDVCLGVGSGSHAEQTARTMTGLEPVLLDSRPDILMVVGDVNSTLAGALTAAKLGVPVAHVESGLRSFDRSMPEEINRVVTDALSELLFTSCRDAGENLRREGVAPEKVHFVGNIMIDSLVNILPRARSSKILQRLDLERGKYVCVTLHRPSNVDNADTLKEILEGLTVLSGTLPVAFSVHPRTRSGIDRLKWQPVDNDIHMLGPLGYVDFVYLMSNSGAVITDSGGIQEETTYLGIPCLTIRENTERPITISEGTNRLITPRHADIVRSVREALAIRDRSVPELELWDGRTADRIFDVLNDYLAL